MSRFEGFFIWFAIGAYTVSFVIALLGFVFKRGRVGQEDSYSRYTLTGFTVLVVALLCQTAAIAVRWFITGHPPVMGAYENSLLGSFFLGATFLIVLRLFPAVRQFYIVIAPIMLLLLGNGLQSGQELSPLEPPYKSNWLYVHVLFGWLAFGSYIVAAVAGFFTLLRQKMAKIFSEKAMDERLLDELSFRLILFGFFSDAVMIGSGAVWAHGLWGRYWAWDPVETWSLISWLIYSLNLHLRLTYGWRGRKAAWLAVLSLIGVIGLFFGIGFVSGVHTRMMG